MPASIKTILKDLHYIHMDGREVFKFAVRAMSKSALEIIKDVGYSIEDVDYMIPHQANIRIIEAVAKKINLTMDKVYVNLNDYGNMSVASIPVALDEAVKNGSIKAGDIIILVAFGGGLTWGSSVIKWCK